MKEFVFNLQRFANKKVTITASNSYANTGSGNDRIYNSGYSNVTILAGSGKDTVYSNGGARAWISAGSGNDRIYNNSYNSTINGGTGNDSISFGTIASGNIVQFAAGDG